MLEASSFDFRNRHPQPLMVKTARRHGYERHSAITKTAYKISLDLYRTFAPLKQSTPTMALACLELAGRLHGQEKADLSHGKEYARWSIDRAMVMGTSLHPETQFPPFIISSISLPRTSKDKHKSHKHESRHKNNTIQSLKSAEHKLIFVSGRNPPRPPRIIHELPKPNLRRAAVRRRDHPQYTDQPAGRTYESPPTSIHRIYHQHRPKGEYR